MPWRFQQSDGFFLAHVCFVRPYSSAIIRNEDIFGSQINGGEANFEETNYQEAVGGQLRDNREPQIKYMNMHAGHV